MLRLWQFLEYDREVTRRAFAAEPVSFRSRAQRIKPISKLSPTKDCSTTARRQDLVDIISSKGIPVGVIVGREIFDRHGTKVYNLKGMNIYRLSGELVGHLTDQSRSHKRLDRGTDRLFQGAPVAIRP